MAKPPEAQTEPAAQPGGKRKKSVLVVAIVAAVLLAAGGAAGWFFLSHKSADHTAQTKPVHHSPPVFVTLEPFVVNLAGDVQHFLQVGIDLKVADAGVSDQIKAHLPEVRNGVLLLLSSKNVEDLASLEGKNQLRDEIRAAVNRPLGIQSAPSQAAAVRPAAAKGADGQTSEAHAAEPAAAAASLQPPHEPDAGVLDVLLTSFVIQ